MNKENTIERQFSVPASFFFLFFLRNLSIDCSVSWRLSGAGRVVLRGKRAIWKFGITLGVVVGPERGSFLISILFKQLELNFPP